MRKTASVGNRRPFRAGMAGVVAAVVLVGSGCGLIGGDSFEVGDCVKTSVGFRSDDMESSDECSDTDALANINGSLYRVQLVLSGTSASCPNLDGVVVEFAHEPHDKTYCLVGPTNYTASTGPSQSGPVEVPGDDGDYTGDGLPPECSEPIMDGREPPEFCEQYG